MNIPTHTHHLNSVTPSHALIQTPRCATLSLHLTSSHTNDYSSSCWFFRSLGFAFATLIHSPLNALMSQLVSSAVPVSKDLQTHPNLAVARALTVKDNAVGVVEVDAVVAVGEHVDVVILHGDQVQLVQQRQ